MCIVKATFAKFMAFSKIANTSAKVINSTLCSDKFTLTVSSCKHEGLNITLERSATEEQNQPFCSLDLPFDSVVYTHNRLIIPMLMLP